jgi:hypothetical protein
MKMRARLTLVLLFAATMARGEANCGRLERYAMHVPAPVRMGEMQVVWMACDGAFRRFEELVPAVTRAEEVYEGWIEVGHVYRATLSGRDLIPLPRMPHHHFGALVWSNAEALPPEDGQRRTIVFAVTDQVIEHRGERMWLNVLGGTLLAVE